jgi:hypothetical protein
MENQNAPIADARKYITRKMAVMPAQDAKTPSQYLWEQSFKILNYP